jgi:hypothetical protein
MSRRSQLGEMSSEMRLDDCGRWPKAGMRSLQLLDEVASPVV